MTTAEDSSRPLDDEPFDPEVAERFRLLERLDPPAIDLRAAAPRPVSLVERRSTGSGRGRVLAIAAALVVIGATSAAVFLSSGERSSGVEAIEAATVEDTTATDDVTERDDSPTTTLVVTGGDDESGGDAASGGAAGDAGSEASDSTGSTETPATTETTVTTTPSVTEDTSSPTTPSTTGTAVPADEVITITGELTEVFTDCASHLVVAPGGQIRSIGEISCDGGSWIKVDGRMIRTSSGFTTRDQVFDRHLADLQPGQQVTVAAIALSGQGLFSLGCPTCGILEIAGVPADGSTTDVTGGGALVGGGDDKDELNQLGGPGGRADE
ncbi:MAG: hypothetical protein AAGA93_26160 [Actinomycetota bacterium]